jgi:hypothetical protein
MPSGGPRGDFVGNRSVCIPIPEPSVAPMVVPVASPFRADIGQVIREGMNRIREGTKMSVPKFVFSRFGRGAALVTAAAMTLAAIEPSVAMAGTATSRVRGLSVSHGVSGNTDISAARRWHYGRGGGAAALAAFAGIAGTIGAIAAARNPYYAYEGGPAYYGGGPAYYGGGPAYYGGGPVYYGGGPVYYGGGPRYYGSPGYGYPGYGYYGGGYGGYRGGVYDPLGYGYNDHRGGQGGQ